MKHLKIFGNVLLAFGIFLVGAAQTAKAQSRQEETAPVARDWTLRIGLFIPNSQTTRGKAGEVGFSGVGERTVYRGETYDINVGIGYNGMGDVYSVPITVMGIFHKDNIRYGLGAGYAFGKRVDGRGMSGTVLALLLGYQLTRGKSPLSLDLRYNFISGSDSELDGYSLTVGTQF